MVTSEFNLVPRMEKESRSWELSTDRHDDRHPLRPLLVLPAGIVELKDPPRVVFGGSQEFICID